MDNEWSMHGEHQEAAQQAEVAVPLSERVAGVETLSEEDREGHHRKPCTQMSPAVPAGYYADKVKEDDQDVCTDAEVVSHAEEGPATLLETARHYDGMNTMNTQRPSAQQREKESAKTAPAEKRVPQRKKKPVCKVNIGNVERQPPILEGVNTPRSVALCEEYGVNPSELAHHNREHFKGTGVSDEVAELRYKSFEKRRRARMAQLKPLYKERVGSDLNGSAPVSADKPQAQSGNRDAALPAAGERAASRPPKATDEDAEMQRQFEAQQQRLLEQERRKTAASGYDSEGHRRSAQGSRQFHATSGRSITSFRSPGRSIASFRSPGRYSRSTSVGSRPTFDQPYSAAKIYSASIAESRALTPSETFMIDEINEREAHRLDTQERAAIIQENKDLMHIEHELMRERQASQRVQKKAEGKLEMQMEMQKRIQERQREAAERRERLEAERLARVRDKVARKESRVHTPEPCS